MLDNVFKPLTIRGKTIKNRLIVPPMVTDYCTPDGKATEKYISYHEEKAKGGWGMIITEDYGIDPRGRGFKATAGLWNDDQIPGHTELVDRVHKHGAVILAQIYHCGRQTNRGAINNTPLAPTAIACPFGTDVPDELTIPQIKEIIQKFIDTAWRCKQCGFDGIQIHGAHGYLVCEFLSPYTNKRTDEYGGNFLNRARFALEIIRGIRKKCGEDFIIDMRVSGQELVEGGLTLEDMKALVPLLEEAGLDMIHVSAAVYASVEDNIPPAASPHGVISDWAKEIKSVCNIPVATVQRINDPHLAESLLRQGKCDFVAMGRASLADPWLPEKARKGEFEDIRHCIACNDGCVGVLFTDNPIRCVLNPSLGDEYNGGLKPADRPKNIMVIGAGPAGLTAAITAAERGHKVTVYDEADRAGGQFYLAAIPPCKGEITDFIRWQKRQCEKLGIPVHYNSDVNLEKIKAENPDLVILATGVIPAIPPIKGKDNVNVHTFKDILLGKVLPGKNCVVIGGGQVGVETAHFLGQMLRDVTVLEKLPEIAADEPLGPKIKLLQNLKKRNVALRPNMEVMEITSSSVIAKNSRGEMEEFPADTVVMATGSRAHNPLQKILEGAGIPFKVIGDAVKPGKVMDATTQGYELGKNI